jgi:hypothetical protein
LGSEIALGKELFTRKLLWVAPRSRQPAHLGRQLLATSDGQMAGVHFFVLGSGGGFWTLSSSPARPICSVLLLVNPLSKRAGRKSTRESGLFPTNSPWAPRRRQWAGLRRKKDVFRKLNLSQDILNRARFLSWPWGASGGLRLISKRGAERGTHVMPCLQMQFALQGS